MNIPEKKSQNLFEILNKRNKKIKSSLKQANKKIKKQKNGKKPQKWTSPETSTFYKCLELFGVEFSLIKEVLSKKSRRQLLRKYHKEKKKFPKKIEIALKNHENICLKKDKKYKKFIDDLFFKSKSDFEVGNFSESSIHEDIGDLIKEEISDEVLPLNYYLNNLD